MNKKFFRKYQIGAVFTFLFAGILFSGCSQPGVNSNKNVSVSNEQATGSKNGAATASSPSNTSANQTAEILWDFRKEPDEKLPKFPEAETDAVLKYVIGDTWDKDLEIASRVSGSFTKPNAKETLYFISGCENSKGVLVSNSNEECGHVSWDTAGWIVIFDGTTPVIKIKESLGNRIGKVTDVNGDGINEILSFAGYANMGIVNEGGTLGQISGDKYQKIKDLSGTSSDCGSTISKDKRVVAAVISYKSATDNKMPDLSEEYFQTKCEGDDIGKNPKWTKITKKQFDDFTGANS